MNETHAAFDSEEQEILSQIVADEDGEMQAADETPPADTTEEQAPAAQPEAKTTEAPAEVKTAEEKPAATPEKPEGNVKAALRASRRAEQRAKEEMEKLRQENEELRKAVPATQSDQDFTPEELESMKVDFPAQYKLYVKQQALAKQLAETRPVAQPASSAEFQPIEFNPEVQELVDQVPDLLNWQHDEASQEKLQRAIAYDRALQADPDWAGKSLLERFTEAAERTKRAFGAVPAPVKAAPAANRTDPAAAIATLKTSGPKGISDFGGGQPASAPEVDFSKLSDEEIMARLPMTN